MKAVVDALIRVALRRWPPELRPDAAQEWAAELAALGAEPGGGRLRRGYRRLAFAASLALSHPPGAVGVPAGSRWREALLGRAETVPHALLLLAVPFLGAKLVEGAQGVAFFVTKTVADQPTITRGSQDFERLTAVAGVTGTAAAVTISALAAWALARRAQTVGLSPRRLLITGVVTPVGPAAGLRLRRARRGR